MGVLEASNGLKVEPDHLYVIPRNTHMSMVRGVLTLTPRGTAPIPHMPIDPFMRSLAAEQRSRAIGVILSGNASDGALGMMAIKAAGGITFAQSPETSKHDGMPRSAIAAGCVDFVLSSREIGKELGRLGKHPYIHPAQSPAEGEAAATQEGVNRILALLWKGTGVDFAQYKSNTIRRRILRRMALRRVENVDAYVDKLRSDSTELHALYEDILINVTEFFRDPETFDALKKTVFPKIVANRQNGAPIRIWVPGCSSGEEVYSVAITLLEFLEEKSHDTGIQIFGTDISEIALEKARSGRNQKPETRNQKPETRNQKPETLPLPPASCSAAAPAILLRMDLKNAVALITGGSAGIGRSIAETLKAAGARVAITGRDQARLAEAARTLGVHPIRADVSNEQDVERTYREVHEKFGDLDILVNNAGFGVFKNLVDFDRASFDAVFATNVTGAMLMAREAAKVFIHRNRGNIVNISSTAGLRGAAKGTAYYASKFALRGMTECWRAELRKYNVRVMLVNPSEVLTDFFQAAGLTQKANETKLRGVEIAHAVKTILEMDDRGFTPELSVFATNPAD